MIKFKIAFLILFVNLVAGQAQNYSFDSGSTSPFQITSGAGSLTLASAPYKDGTKSMCWAWTSSATTLQLNYTITANDWRDGVLFWVYNETPSTKPLRAEFRSSSGAVQYYFDFGLNFSGWRICRIGTAYMKGTKSIKTGLRLNLISPTGVTNGRLYIDRFSYLADVDADNAPDAQQPENNIVSALSHWGLIWEWENTLNYTTTLKTSLTSAEQASLASIITGISGTVPKTANATVIATANTLLTSSAISLQNGFLTGAPFVTQWDKKTGDISFTDIGSMLLGFAEDYLYNGVAASKDKFMLVWDYAQSQGFSYGSSMGVNHHYGYNTREIFSALFLMRNELKSSGRLPATVSTLSYWSGLPETRANYDFNRNGVVDCWNTLLMSRLIAAAMIDSETERYRAIESLNDWLAGSLLPTPGNTGGIKPDGTIFHHGGAYPAYAIGGLGSLGNYCESIYKSTFTLPKASRLSMANGLLAMSNYTNKKDWSIGFSGRHPFSGSISQAVIDAMAFLSMMGGIYDDNTKFDKRLASAYLRHQTTSGSIRTLVINTTGATAAPDPQGFYVFNHAAMGIHRTGNAMVSIKGYNSDVWGSEIYTNDNLYGRYQSYGAIEIMNGGNPVTQASSRFLQPGWDWNRLPGTTTIHLPNNLLKSPLTTTVMSRSDEDFAGASSLDTLYGIFGMKLHEKSDIINTNYTPGFRARKSVFAFGKRLICLGSNISNTNSTYNTETTLFQNALSTTSETININDVSTVAFGTNLTLSKSANTNLLSDVLGNYYRVAPQTEIKVKGSTQSSNDQETAAATTGNFVAAWINHGAAPSLQKYEYMIMVKPTTDELNIWKSTPGYTVIQCDNNAHIVKDVENNITGYVSFLDVSPASGMITDISAESLVMLREIDSSHLSMSVSDPSIHLPVKVLGSAITSSASQVVVKDLVLTGRWLMDGTNSNVALSYINNSTVLSVSCQLGLPVEFKLKQSATATPEINHSGLSEIKTVYRDGKLCIIGNMHFSADDSISVYNSLGQSIITKSLLSPTQSLPENLAPGAYLVTLQINGEKRTDKIIIQ